jgi:hypothetical protein
VFLGGDKTTKQSLHRRNMPTEGMQSNKKTKIHTQKTRKNKKDKNKQTSNNKQTAVP